MKLVPSETFYENNPNAKLGITFDMYCHLHETIVYYLAEVGKDLHLPHYIISAASMYLGVYYEKNLITSSDRHIMAIAALLVGTKAYNHKRKIADFSINYHKRSFPPGHIALPLKD